MTRRQKRWCFVAAAAALVYSAGTLFQPTVVVGQSMYPTLPSGKVIWVDRLYYRLHKPQEGEVIVFRRGENTYVKRIYRGPGEPVHYLAAGNDWVAPIRETRVEEMRERYNRNNRTALKVRSFLVPDDSVFVIGDNFAISEDSRAFGPVPVSSIIGRAHLEQNPVAAMVSEITPHGFFRPGGAAGMPPTAPARPFRVRTIGGAARNVVPEHVKAERS